MSFEKGEQMELGNTGDSAKPDKPEKKVPYQIPQGEDRISCNICRDETRFCQHCERGRLEQFKAKKDGEDIWYNKKAS